MMGITVLCDLDHRIRCAGSEEYRRIEMASHGDAVRTKAHYNKAIEED
jgi:hypothetical protein